MTNYEITAHAKGSFDEVVARTRIALSDEGFGVLSEINVAATLKEKLNIEFGEYLILGACHPPSAYRALKAEPEIGLLLPCNVIIYINADSTVVVSAIRPTVAMKMTDNQAIAAVAEEIEQKLEKIIGLVGSS